MIDSEIENIVKHYFPKLEGASLNSIISHSSLYKSSKGTQLITEGKRHPYFYIILKGSVKSYYYKDSKEVCTWFAIENDVVGSVLTSEGYPSKETIELLEDSVFIRFNVEQLKKLAESDLQIIHLLNEILIEHTLFIEDRLYQLQFMTSEERYINLINSAPEILQRVSLTDIASFLGIGRETLSRIRKSK